MTTITKDYVGTHLVSPKGSLFGSKASKQAQATALAAVKAALVVNGEDRVRSFPFVRMGEENKGAQKDDIVSIASARSQLLASNASRPKPIPTPAVLSRPIYLRLQQG